MSLGGNFVRGMSNFVRGTAWSYTKLLMPRTLNYLHDKELRNRIYGIFDTFG